MTARRMLAAAERGRLRHSTRTVLTPGRLVTILRLPVDGLLEIEGRALLVAPVRGSPDIWLVKFRHMPKPCRRVVTAALVRVSHDLLEGLHRLWRAERLPELLADAPWDDSLSPSAGVAFRTGKSTRTNGPRQTASRPDGHSISSRSKRRTR